MSSMREAVAVSRMRQGDKFMSAQSDPPRDGDDEILSIDWKEALYLATRGGAIALNLPKGAGTFTKGAPFDAQCSKLIYVQYMTVR